MHGIPNGYTTVAYPSTHGAPILQAFAFEVRADCKLTLLCMLQRFKFSLFSSTSDIEKFLSQKVFV